MPLFRRKLPNSANNVHPGRFMVKSFGVLLFALLAAVPVTGEDSLPARDRNPEPFPFPAQFQKEFRELFAMLAVEYPQFQNRLSEQDVERALLAVMERLGSGLSLDRNGAGKPSTASVRETKNPPPVRLSNGIVYLRLNVIGSEEVSELLNLLKTEERGVILDLRSCSSGNGAELARRLSRFLVETRTAGGPHTAILTGPETEGASEMLASMLTASRKGIRIGEATAGKPYPRKTVTVSSRKWLVPLPPEGAGNVRYARLLPQIAIPSVPQASYDKVRAEQFASSGDRCLSRAADLLISLDLLDKKGLKK